MRSVRQAVLAVFVVCLLGLGMLASPSSRSNEAAAQPAIGLQALCVNYYTSIASTPTPITSATCPAGTFALDIPDDFPFTLAINPYTGQVLYNPNPSPPYFPIVFPDSGTVPFCVSLYTGQLRYAPGGTCSSGFYGVSVVGETEPIAVDDGPYIELSGGNISVPAPGLLTNDDLGLPAAEIVSFGVGDATANPAGTPINFAGGVLTVNADGSFTLPNVTLSGDHSFMYRLENAAGFDEATVTIQIQALPDAVDDGPYTVLEGNTLTITTSDANDLLDNDTLGFPLAEIVSFGGGSLAGDATEFDAGDTVPLGGGTLTVNADGSITLDTPTTGDEYTFQYRLQNAASFNDATVTIQVQRAPDTVDDGPFVMQVSTQLDVVGPGLLGNDDTGFPITGIDSFGVGDATANLAGVTVIDGLAGGDLTVNADGSFSLDSPHQTGEFTFLYRLTNDAGSDDATVAIQIQGPPDAVDDGPAADSSPGDLFHTAFDTTLDSTQTAGDDNLLSNDDLGFPEGDIVSFGGGDLGGTVVSNAAGETAVVIDQPSGSLTVNADGSFVFVPTTGFTGEFSFQYRLENDAASDDATVTIAVGVRPAALDDSYNPTVLGNVSIDTSTSTGFSVLDNDAGDDLDFTTTALTSTEGGDVTLNADGTFEYDPPPGYEGADSFTYEIDNGFNDPQQGTVSLTVSGMIWFIDLNAAEGGDGRLSHPFDCLVNPQCFSALASDEAGDSIFLASGDYGGGLTLLNDQIFVGEGSSQSLSAATGLTPPADSPSLPATGGGNPQITTSNADAITLGLRNAIAGMTIGNTGTGTAITGANFDTFVVTEVTISGTGQALDLSNGDVVATFDSIASASASGTAIILSGITSNFTFDVLGATTILNPSGNGISITSSSANFDFQGTTTIDGTGTNGIGLVGSNGSVAFASIDLDGINAVGLRVENNTNPVIINGGSIGATNDPGGDAVNIDGGSGNVSIAATVTKTTTSEVVEVTGRTGGTVTFSNTITCNTGCTGVNVSTNTSGTTSFTGSVTASTGGNTAVDLDTNNSHSVSFSGGLDIDTTSGIGFNAVGGGTVEVLADSVTNTVNSGSATAVSIQNTTISSQGVTFQSISVNGASNGVVLDSTGSNGGFAVTGVGTTDGSGGTIQNITNRGVEASSTQNLVLSNVAFVNTATSDGVGPCGNNVTGNSGCNAAIYLSDVDTVTLTNISTSGGQTGINGLNVTDFSLIDSLIANSGNEEEEDGVRFTNLIGTALIQDTTITTSEMNNLRVYNTVSTPLILTVDGTTPVSPVVPSAFLNAHRDDGIAFEGVSNANMTLSVTDTRFENSDGDHVQTAVDDNTTMAFTFTDNATEGGTGFSGTGVLGSGITVSSSADWSGSMTFDISDNHIQNAVANAVNINLGTQFGTGAYSGTVADNTIGTDNDVDSGGAGIAVTGNGSGTITILVTGNRITEWNADYGIDVLHRDGDGTLNATITNNVLVNAPVDGFNGLSVVAGATSGPPEDSGTINAHIAGNTLEGTGVDSTDVRIRQRFSTTFNLSQGASASSDPIVVIQDNNVGTPSVSFTGTINIVGTFPPTPS